jgi:RNA polymerase sigma factor (sigma-70 family)
LSSVPSAETYRTCAFRLDSQEVTTLANTCRDSQLVHACVAGDEHAWAALIEKYKRLIYSIPIRYGIDRENAAEIFQSVCVELFCELRKIRKAESIKWWLITVTARKCLRWKNRRGAEINVDDVGCIDLIYSSDAAPEILQQAAREQYLRDSIAELSSRCRELIQLLFYVNPPLPYAEIARKLGLATGSIGFIRGRCLGKLRNKLSQVDF